jgi:nucleotide-binding universal stress UspA family protein
MGKILCPTRGGEDSYRAQDVAIEMAKKQGKPLVFLYVVDIHLLDRARRAVRPSVVSEEMARMGEFLLAMAQERAEAQGVQAEVRIRYGEVCDEVKAAAQAEGADVVILGRPMGAECRFQIPGLETLAAEVEAEIGAQTQIV